ncbi:MAG: flagellar biosynthetic protein FliO [Candidatus Neptunochlamydia sp.]|nr:flagellar biosynthetic protein FliO [Candidatus Neptunochlamydia sp.]
MPILKLLLILSFVPLLAEETLAPSLMNVELVVDPAPKREEKKETPPEKKKEEAAPTKAKEMDEKECIPSEEYHQTSHDVHKATESYETAFIKTIVVLVGLLVLVILTVWMFRKISHGRLHGMNVLKSVKILEKRPLSPKSMLYLIEVGGKQVLIAESQLEVRNVATLNWLGSDKDL